VQGISRNIYLLLCTITLLAFALSAAFVAVAIPILPEFNRADFSQTGFAFADPFTSDTRIWSERHATASIRNLTVFNSS
jgi:hypothetical protein